MVSLDDIKELLLYKKQFFLPINLDDKKKGSAIFLLTPNYKSSLLSMTLPYAINRRYFESYYMNKAIMMYIQNESVYSCTDPGEYIFEDALTSKERNALDDSVFGLPSQRRYPLNDESHVLSAIRLFNHVEKEYEKELAENIIKRIKELDMASKVHVGEGNRFKPYWDKSSLSSKNESTIIEEEFSEDDRTYFNEFVKISSTINWLNNKMTFSNIVLTGYERDVNEVKKNINDIKKTGYDIGNIEFKKLRLETPEKISIEVLGSSNTKDGIDTDNNILSIYSINAFKSAGMEFKYTDYIKYMIQLYAVYSMQSSISNVRISETLANPFAVYLSGIADKKLKDDSNIHDDFASERVFKYIVNTYGIEAAKVIIKGNNFNQFWKYAREYNSSIRESDLNFNDLDSINEVGELPDVSIQMPEDLSRLSKFSTRLKRKIRKPIYKMNKIARDLARGNLGQENKSGQDTTLTQLQTGDITGDSVPEKIDGKAADGSEGEVHSEGTLDQFKRWSNGDYILEGNYMYLFEDNKSYDLYLRKALYRDRFRNDKQLLNYYKRVKLDLPFIKFAYLDLNRYNNKNLFVDLSYYNESFFKNMEELNVEDKSNTLKIFKIYIELMSRLLNTYISASYKKRTIFIPVLDWKHNNSTRMWMYKDDINPISVIYYLMKYDKSSLISLFGDTDIVFLGAKNYFKMNISHMDLSKPYNIQKFITLINRISALGYSSPADPDPEGELDSSPSGIAMDIIDKVEKSQNVSIDNLSGFKNLKQDVNMFASNDAGSSDTETAVKKKVAPNKDSEGNTSVEDTRSKINYKDYSNSTRGKKAVATVTVNTVELNKSDIIKSTKPDSVNKAVNNTTEDEKKKAIVDKVVDAANNSNSTDDALDKLNSDEFKQMVTDLQNDSESNMRVDESRASKIVAMEDEFHNKQVAGKSVKDLLNEDPAKHELATTDLHIASINKDWSEMKFMNFDKNYDPDSDIMKMLDSMKNWTFPIAIKNIEVTDNSTSEDIVDLWKIECVDYKGTRFTLKVDIPRFINGSNFLKLRGNEKNLLIQSTMVPITKTASDACQIIGSGGYNKTFIYRVGNRRGQTMPSSNRLIKSLNQCLKNNSSKIKIVLGDNSKVCEKYDLPIDYIDIASGIDSIKTKNIELYFNQDELRLNYKIDDTKGIPLGIEKSLDPKTNTASERVLYFTTELKKNFTTVTNYISNILRTDCDEFNKYYESISVAGSRYSYSQASILSIRMPLVVMCGYLVGLIPVMKKANIEYQFIEKLTPEIRNGNDYDYIRFSDGFLIYKVNYSSSLLMNGLKENDTENYSIRDVNNRKMYFEFLENYGGALKADGLENAYDCMIDPITKEILEMYKLPSDYIGVMIHANNLMADNKFVRHTYQAGRRWRRKELIAGYFYKVLTTAYQEYANSIRHNRKSSKMSMKQSAVIDFILSGDPATTDLSVNNVINDLECANTVTNKGLVGMNSARAYSVGTRTYDESMLNVLGMDTAFSGSVGINRQATVDPNIESGRGIVKSIDGDADKLSAAKTMTITEAMTPFGSTHDDPQRTLMTFLQTSKHMIRCEKNDPALVTTGADEALPYLCSDIFAFKAKDAGTVVELVEDDYMIVEYKNGNHQYIDLKEQIKHNSDGGYFVPMKLYTDLKVGSKFKEGNVLAYDRLSFSKSLGESGNLCSNLGTLAKIAIINTDEAFEDSAVITESFAEKLGSDVIMNVETVVDKGSNIFIYKEIGDHVMEGDTLFTYQPDFDDDVANVLLKNLSINDEELSELGRNPIKSKYTGTVAGIEIYRTVELDELSPSLRKFCEAYEKKINRTKAIYKKYGLDPNTLPPTTKLPNVGKAKNIDEGVKIIYYIKHLDTMSVGDKIVFYSANKGIIKYIIDKDSEPYTDFRPDEHIDSFMSLSSISSRMTASIAIYCAVGKLMVELDRSVKDLAGIPYDVSNL